MGKLLYIKASPRDRSYSVAVANAFIDLYRNLHPDEEIETLDVFREQLPCFNGFTVQAKYAIMHGLERSHAEAQAWQGVEKVIKRFKSADKYVIATPMWNFGIPYRLKHYIDLLVQPGYTFTYSEQQGYRGLVIDKPLVVVYARGGTYLAEQARCLDMQKAYIELVFGFMGFTDIRSILVEPTLQQGPEAARQVLEAAITDAQKLAEEF
ncbi:MAG: NAD(P)H-dependent oxidoreductase [Planctomycetota bacterium]